MVMVLTTHLYRGGHIPDSMIDKLKKLRNLLNQWEIHTTAPINWEQRERWIDEMLDIIDELEKMHMGRTKGPQSPIGPQSDPPDISGHA